MVLPRLPHRSIKVPASLILVLSCLLVAFAGCGKKTSVKQETTALEQAFPGIASVAPAQLNAAGVSSTSDPKACVSAAVVALHTNDYVTAAIMLQKALEFPGANPDQVMLLQATRK